MKYRPHAHTEYAIKIPNKCHIHPSKYTAEAWSCLWIQPSVECDWIICYSPLLSIVHTHIKSRTILSMCDLCILIMITRISTNQITIILYYINKLDINKSTILFKSFQLNFKTCDSYRIKLSNIIICYDFFFLFIQFDYLSDAGGWKCVGKREQEKKKHV